MDVKAIAKDIRISPIKARLVVDLVRGKNANDAINILNNYNNKAARIVKKVVDSAVANAVNNNNMDADKLYIKDIRSDVATTLKRRVPGSRGKIDNFFHRKSHITVVVAEKEVKVVGKAKEKVEEPVKKAPKAAPKKAVKTTKKAER